MKNELGDVRDEIRIQMKNYEYDFKDMKKRMNSYKLFEKFMNRKAFITFDLQNK